MTTWEFLGLMAFVVGFVAVGAAAVGVQLMPKRKGHDNADK